MHRKVQIPITQSGIEPASTRRPARLAWLLLGLAFLGQLLAPLELSAATVWTGPVTNFTDLDGSDPTQPRNQDRLTANVWITRGSSQGIYNAATETGFTHFFSPQDTEWANGTLANYASLSYTDWDTWAKNVNGGPPFTVGVPAVVHLIAEDIYLSVQFTEWGEQTGGFSWQRSTPQPADVPPTVSITSPTNGASFTAPANVPITASASDSDGTVTNVSFFDGATFLGKTNNTPYTVTTSLAVGAHALTTVATDNAGLSTTSSVVNVTVNVGHSPPSVTMTNPPDNSVFGNTDSITIGASVTDTGASVTNVQMFDGLVSLRSFSAPPYSFTTGQFAFTLGTHTITAVASDSLGASGTSAPVHLTIARYTPEVTNGALSLFLIPIATNLAAPDYGFSPPGDTHRLFVLEQNGLVWLIQDGVLLPTPALDIQSRVSPPLVTSNPNDERGLLGIAFHPGFNNPASPGYQTLYTYNSEMVPSNTLPTYPLSGGTSNLYRNVLNEWKISPTNANIIDPSTRREVISFGKNAQNHNGGTCTFGPDGYMYLALGDGGNANDVGPGHIAPGGNAQNLSVPLGKMLRFDPLNPALNTNSPDPVSTNGQYRIPTTNPFQGPNQVPEIYAYGFRNPYRYCFDPVTGDLIEADVGQNNIEEINRVLIAHNYGWAIKEGDYLFNMTNNQVGPNQPAGTVGPPPTNNFSPGAPAGLTDPITGPQGILEYDHNNGISITGGFVYRGSAMPELYGKYIFGDLALIPSPVRINGRLFYADLQQGTMHAFTLPQFGSEILPNDQTVHGFGQDGNGELYAMATSTPPNGNGGVVYKLASVRLTAQVTGNLLALSWPVAGGRLQAQTNSPGVGITTNWVTVPGSTATNHIVFQVNPASGSVFYRLAVP
ncbi:MAG TPA: PQQ-dependent sugar dehydrogenase [Candidatus Acidoferrum sp.]|nr:PQQ-dependent sugar dehydrogenase [Candidatus Acidoferrum sp.]